MNRVLFVTGASSGIGRETARQAAAAGYRLALFARSEARLASLVDELETPDGGPGRTGRALALPGDVRDREALADAVEQTLGRFGAIDAVFANAGIGGAPGGFREAPPESWEALLMVNVYGLALTLQATAAALAASRGQAVITSSLAGRRSLAGSMYSATKWAATCIGHGFRKEIAGSGVRVCIVEPGMVDTPFFDEPKPGHLEAADVARAVLYALEQPERCEVHEITLVPTRTKDDNLVP